jgi:hypothetical protein
MENQKTILGPRSFPIWAIQIFGLCCPVLTVIIALSAIITSNVSSLTAKDLFYLTAIIGPLVLISILMLYVPQKYIPRVKVDEPQGIFQIIKKGHSPQVYELSSIKSFISKRILTIPGGKNKILINKTDGSSTEIFNEDLPFSGIFWESFAEKISVLTNKQLVKEIWAENYNGKLSLISPESMQTNKNKGMLLFAVPLCMRWTPNPGQPIGILKL